MSNTVTPTRLTRDDVLVDAAWLAQHLHDPNVRVVEIDVSSAAYNAGHIAGAVLVERLRRPQGRQLSDCA